MGMQKTGPVAEGQPCEPMPPRGAVALVFDPVFGTLFWGKLVSFAGTWIHGIVAAIVLYQATRSALMVALVTTVQFAPQVVLSPLSGKLADHGHAAVQILLGRLACFAGSGSLAVWYATTDSVGATATSVAVLGSTLLLGLGFVVGGPAMNSIVPDLIRPGELSTAMALNVLPMTLGRVLGPVVGALVVAQSGPTLAFTVAAGLQGAFALAILGARLPKGIRPASTIDLSVTAAFRYTLKDRPLVLMLAIVAGMGCGAEPAMTLAPAMAVELGGGAEVVSWLTGGFGAGALLGLLVLTMLSRHLVTEVTVAGGLWAMSIGLLGAAASNVTALAVAAFVLVGVGFTLGLTSVTTLIQARSPRVLRGRIMAFWMIAFVGTRPLAAVMNGLVADASSVGLSIMVSGAVVALLALVGTPRRVAG
jgi:predicted MFS family arabinose efflux permease